MAISERGETKIIFTSLDDLQFKVEVESFLDASEMHEEGYYDYYYSGYFFSVKVDDKEVIDGTKYDDEEHISLNKNLNELTIHSKTIKTLLKNLFSVKRFEYIYAKDYTYAWCMDNEEVLWRGTRMGNVRLYDVNNILRYQGELNEWGKFHGKGKLFAEDSSLICEGHFNNDCFFG
ncbi:hypothetical protein [Paenibacillus mucilaginosus]|uniref:Uncharacterized protein n=1 Tax=Paenibacillus mucilaginosus (strain KNP414) TaxID=1036673 RepID=F8FEC8_PAEMK|nr:hypothetical protein [Paenibacillus mucilaginosus]AEI44527.1 hypothetical protein KNP414_06003 [Paenibacillus mucilaginosus KNP414]MCG7217478.1 hypothetical protein [Paenibacillus mucilaginosus]WDM30879.1 hypothetical protein KCX80_17720 [Paenibacillus mucilaginosus]